MQLVDGSAGAGLRGGAYVGLVGLPCIQGSRGDRVACALRAAVQILWKFSIYLESIAILPQLVLLTRTQNTDNLTGNYIFLLGWVTLRVQQSSVYAAAVGQPGGVGWHSCNANLPSACKCTQLQPIGIPGICPLAFRAV
jgi:hypothetical protein